MEENDKRQVEERPSPTAPDARNGTEAADLTIRRVGARIRQLRSKQSMTLKDVADRTGVSVSMLSMLERGIASASVGTLVSVASALGVHMQDLFDRPDVAQKSPVTRRDEQTVVTTHAGATRRVVYQDIRTGVEVAINEYESSGASGDKATHHDGREFGIVISGELAVELDGQFYHLQPGDSIAYSSQLPHRIANRQDGPTTAFWVNLDV